MIRSGDPVNYDADTAVRHVLPRRGVRGLKVKITLPWDPSGKRGPTRPPPDHVSIVEPKDERPPTAPSRNRRVGGQSHLPCPSPYPQLHRVSLAAGSGVWMLLYKDL
ncbi:40S ribosomal protein S3-B [Myotis davidii]|uniref:40S ribosomal protein S3-B n=1 Tax=Myotis davidii TaxID=225400 RepID=L5LPU2_MYODS|nr:40S ribosomal protein S3-B [Myotis davidii]